MRKHIKFGDDVDYSLYNLDAEEFVCSGHINDGYITEHIKVNGAIGKCTHCKKKKMVIELFEILKLVTSKEFVNKKDLNQ